MLGRGMADDGPWPGLAHARNSADTDGHLARRACGCTRPLSGTGGGDRRLSRAPIPIGVDRCAL